MTKKVHNIKISREEILSVYAQGPEKVVELIENLVNLFNHQLNAQAKVIEQLQDRVKDLENRLSKDSHNSHKPPSSDGLKKKSTSQSIKKKSNRKVGGQKNHPGHTLKLSDTPDHKLTHSVYECKTCGFSLEDAVVIDYERRQVFDIPSLKLEISEHQAQIKDCPCCLTRNKAQFPQGIDNVVQYGEALKSLAIYLSKYQLLPYDRSKAFFEDVFSHSLSVASLMSACRVCYDLLAPFEVSVKKLIQQSPTINFDETGYRVNAHTRWLHVATTPYLTYYMSHPKRGKLAMDEMGILSNYQGCAVHDYWKAYYHYSCQHALCNAHHLRELTFIDEKYQQSWAAEMINLLLQIKKITDQARQVAHRLAKGAILYFEKRYQKILDKGFQANPPPLIEEANKKRGRKKQTKPQNLLDRFKERQQEILAFMYDFNIPFDNNLAERDLRMMKVQQKISGCFRTEQGADIFCRIRSYISTVRKQGINVLQAIKQALQGNPYIPQGQPE